MNSEIFVCPICKTNKNSWGNEFTSDWAVAMHAAGKIVHHDKLHESWFYKHAPQLAKFDYWQKLPSLATELISTFGPKLSGTTQSSNKDEFPLFEVHELERNLHLFVISKLKQRFGEDEETWWVEGVPVQIRQECQSRRESNSDRKEVTTYMYLIDLKIIIDKNWNLFEEDHAKVRILYPDCQKKKFLSYLGQLNEIRNRYSHPLRSPKAGDPQIIEDKETLTNLIRIFHIFTRKES